MTDIAKSIRTSAQRSFPAHRIVTSGTDLNGAPRLIEQLQFAAPMTAAVPRGPGPARDSPAGRGRLGAGQLDGRAVVPSRCHPGEPCPDSAFVATSSQGVQFPPLTCAKGALQAGTIARLSVSLDLEAGTNAGLSVSLEPEVACNPEESAPRGGAAGRGAFRCAICGMEAAKSARARVRCGRLRRMSVPINADRVVRDVIVIGASAGGIRAVIDVLARLSADLPAFIGVVIHRGAVSADNWSQVIGMKTSLRVVEPADGDALERGVVYVAPADCHMRFERDRVRLDGDAKKHFTRPAVDPLFSSAALAYGPRVVAVVLTGGGHDGMLGLLDVSTAGGLALVQKPSEAADASMPTYAIAHDHVLAALGVDEIGDALAQLARGEVVGISAAEAAAARDTGSEGA